MPGSFAHGLYELVSSLGDNFAEEGLVFICRGNRIAARPKLLAQGGQVQMLTVSIGLPQGGIMEADQLLDFFPIFDGCSASIR